MPAGAACWGIEIGQCALKAIRLRPAGDGRVELLAFDVIEHAKILSQPDADQDELIREALQKFVSRNQLAGDRVVVGVPGQQTFARICKLPPGVDPKKLPSLVRFEASQQIPFDMDEVVWDYQTFSTPDSPDLEVGIFAMRKDLIRRYVDALAGVKLAPTIVQAIPAALYNFAQFEFPEQSKGAASLLISVGAQNTDLVVVEPNSAWMRNIPLGGNNFTEALVRAFKLTFAKAESLKRTAASSKYARQVFQAMRPVFAELVAEIQRSIGFYCSTHRDVELRRVVAMGNAFRLPGLQKYLENNLTVGGGVIRLERFAKLVVPQGLNAAGFEENILTFAPAYGLALQGLELAKINASLLPSELARVAAWRRKRPYFVAAAACLGLAAAMPYVRTALDQKALASDQAAEVQAAARRVIAEAQRYRTEFQKVQTNTAEQEKNIKALLELRKDRALIPSVVALVYESLPPPHELLRTVESPEQLRQLAQSGRLKRTERRQFLIDSIEIEYQEDIDAFTLPGTAVASAAPSGPRAGPRAAGVKAAGGAVDLGADAAAFLSSGGGAVRTAAPGPKVRPAGQAGGGFYVKVSGRLLYGEQAGDAIAFFTDEYYPALREKAAQPGRGFHIPDDSEDRTRVNISRPDLRRATAGPAVTRGGAAVTPGASEAAPTDPVTGEDTSTDWLVSFGFKIKVGDKPAPTQKAKGPDKPKP
jgi:type IV pilus assembly protein PilM